MLNLTSFVIDIVQVAPIIIFVAVEFPNNGCLLLNHDEPVASRTNYNTSNDVLALIADPDYAAWFKV